MGRNRTDDEHIRDLVRQLAVGDRAALASVSDLLVAVELLGQQGGRHYDRRYAADLVAACFSASGGGERRSVVRLADLLQRNVPHNRETFIAVANQILYTVQDEYTIETLIASPRVSDISDFATQPVKLAASLLSAGDRKLSHAFAARAVPRFDRDDTQVMPSMFSLCAAAFRGDVGTILSFLDTELRTSGAGRVAHWPQLMVYAARHAAIGGVSTRELHPSILLKKVGECGDAPVLEFIRVGITGSLREITTVARKV